MSNVGIFRPSLTMAGPLQVRMFYNGELNLLISCSHIHHHGPHALTHAYTAHHDTASLSIRENTYQLPNGPRSLRHGRYLR